MKNKKAKIYSLFALLILSKAILIQAQSERSNTESFVPSFDINGQRTGPYYIPLPTTEMSVPTACIEIERQRLCGLEIKDWCQQNNTDVCQKVMEYFNLNTP